MTEIILLKHGELALKGLNRRTFEDMLTKTLRRRLSVLGGWRFAAAQSAVAAEPLGEGCDLDAAVRICEKVFGLSGISRALAVPKDMEVIRAEAVPYLRGQLTAARTFKVNAKRADKRFPLTSPEICVDLGAVLLDAYPHLTVDVHDPDITVTVEIRDSAAYIHGNQLRGAGGLPPGSSGKAAALISGGIDSPVAAWMMARRGLALDAIHFASPPYTGERAEMKVHSLLHKVAEYSGRINLHVVPFTEIQEAIKDNCPEELFTIIMRRFMMVISEKIAHNNDCGALITGESVGQVASQTLGALVCTDCAVSMPVFRPLIGMDKDETVALARKIGTFEISVLPYEDCCTVFTPRHPRTKPILKFVEEAEARLDFDRLVGNALAGVRHIMIDSYS
ncbi:MAG: tRNA 4-thiouridine(8) synthase ThiI [Oscillospiraceae bacterium]|nr:tRNA 4-thiouridine(8) synthase ThiI [Oscillospiraceae bacterium]